MKTAKGTELQLLDLRGKKYLPVQQRVLWFREEHPNWGIETELQSVQSATLAKAWIKDESGRVVAMGHKYEDAQGFADHREKAESGAVGRALGFLGYGTQFALELEEGDRLADSPVERKSIAVNQRLSPNEITRMKQLQEQLAGMGTIVKARE
jgi:hypothetical protein